MTGVNRQLRSAVVVDPVRVEDLPKRRRIIEATPEDTGTGQACGAVVEGAAVVFLCGGDGTVRSVIAGLVETDVALAVLPAGTRDGPAAQNTDLPDGAARPAGC